MKQKMNNNNKINLIGLILIVLISLLFFIVPITPAFVISYIFTIIAIIILNRTVTAFGKSNNDVTQSYANIYITCGYVVAVVIFSLIAYILFSYSILWTMIIHIGILGVFSIIFLILGAGNEYISKLDNQKTTEERKKFVEQKKKYWK